MKLILLLGFLLVTACSTLSQTVETPVLVRKKKFAAGAGALYSHNINQNDLAKDEAAEYKPQFFLGGRYGLSNKVELAVAGGTLGLTDGSALDLRIRYQYWNGWRQPPEVEEPDHPEEDENEPSLDEEEAKLKKGKKKLKKGAKRKPQAEETEVAQEEESDEELDETEVEEILADPLPIMADGWVGTLSFGGFWSGFNKIQDFSVNQYDGGVYLSNAFGYKKGGRVFYFGLKLMQLETEYRYKANRFLVAEDINSKYNEFTYGAFFGFTYQWETREKHGYIIDTLVSVLKLPKNSLDRTDSYYPALVLSGWYID